jgi:hypothetical protein
MQKILILATTLFILSSCAELQQVIKTFDTNLPLTQTEIISGLKEALLIGTDSSATRLSKVNGYFADEMVKILLPPEADVIVKNISKIPGGDKLVNDLILRINRAAEDAAAEVKPVYANSIRNMTISDAVGILKGPDNAATEFFRTTTFDQLYGLYQPKIKTSLDKKLIAGISATESWDKLTGEWNKIAGSVVGQVAGFKPVATKLDQYLTTKALDGLFVKIAEQEKLIRHDPVARVTEILKRVFGSV